MEDRLAKFAQIVEAGSFTKAARLLHVSQPALTTALKKLERELHAELLVRGSHTMKVTPAGQAAYQAAKQIQLQTTNLHAQLQSLADQKPDFNLGTIDSMANLLFVHGTTLKELEQASHLSLSVNNSSQLLQLVAHNTIDVALIARPVHVPPALTIIPLGKEPLVCVVHVAHAEEAKRHMQRGTVPRFLAYNKNSRTYALIARHFEQQSIDIQPVFYSTSPELILQLVLAKRGVAVLPYLLVAHHIASGEIAAVMPGDVPVIARDIVAMHRTGRALSAPATHIITAATDALTALFHTATNNIRASS